MPTDRKPRRSLAAWLVPAATFVAGAAVALAFAPSSPPDTATADTPTFGVSSPAAPPANAAVQTELALMLDINARFVDQLRLYESRMGAIAMAADEEGAPQSAESLRDFALETKLLIERYDKISKGN